MEEALTQSVTSIMEIMNSLAIVHITQCLFLKYTHRQTHTCTHRHTVLILSVPSTKLCTDVKDRLLDYVGEGKGGMV